VVYFEYNSSIISAPGGAPSLTPLPALQEIDGFRVQAWATINSSDEYNDDEDDMNIDVTLW